MDSRNDSSGIAGKSGEMHILLVEPAHELAHRIVTYLERAGLQISHYFSADGVLQHLMGRKAAADLVIMDMGTGNLSEAIKVAFEIRKTHIVPLLFLTASKEDSMAGESSGLASCSFFSREITLSQLDALIRAIVESTEIRYRMD